MNDFSHLPANRLVVAAPAPSPAPIYKALAAAGLIAPFLSHGAIITVTTTDAVGGPATCSLRDAARAVRFPGSSIRACAVADVAPAGNEVRFAANVVGTITYTNVDNFANYAGVEFAPRSDLSIVGPGAASLAVSCDANAVTIGSMMVFTNVASNIAISGLSFRDCLAPSGFTGAGGLSVFDAGANSVNQITLSDLVASGNSGLVGGISVSSVGATIIRRVSVTNNNGLVGGITVQATSTRGDVDMQSSTIANNVGQFVSGAYFATPGDVSVNNVTVSGNSGGVAAIGAQGAQVGIRHSTIVRNTPGVNVTNYAALSYIETIPAMSARAGAKALSVSPGLNNSIVCGNTTADFSPVGNAIGNYNLMGVILPPGTINGTGNVNGCTDVQLNGWLGPLANNGGPTQTHALLNVPGNPAINGGDPAYVGSPGDQTGVNARTSGGRTDMGAFEFVAQAANSSSTPVPVNGLAGLGALSLALAALGARRRKKDGEKKA